MVEPIIGAINACSAAAAATAALGCTRARTLAEVFILDVESRFIVSGAWLIMELMFYMPTDRQHDIGLGSLGL